jgi:hypothetical protein
MRSIIVTVLCLAFLKAEFSQAFGPPMMQQLSIESKGPVEIFEVIYGIKIESWSLFLICNPSWLLHKNREKIIELYKQFSVFSRVIGKKHLAVWFWKRQPSLWVAEELDVERSIQYCTKFRLLPSQSPHILVTTTYPENEAIGDYISVKLNDADTHEITALLGKLADQIIIEGLSQKSIDSEQY